MGVQKLTLTFLYNLLFVQNERMPLHWAASGGHTDIVKFLLDLGVPVDNKDDVSFLYFFCSSLHDASFNIFLLNAALQWRPPVKTSLIFIFHYSRLG